MKQINVWAKQSVSEYITAGGTGCNHRPSKGENLPFSHKLSFHP
jgi:hypothetical protein